MHFSSPLIKATLIKRYKRFLADMRLDDGEVITAHCANPGSMMGLKEEGAVCWLSTSNNPKRKLKYSWELLQLGDDFVGINTSYPNGLVMESLDGRHIHQLAGYETLTREVKYGTNSRIDILAKAKGRRDCYIEVKNVNLMRVDGVAEFPDSVTKRGAKHLDELSTMCKAGHRSVMLYIIQRTDAKTFSLAKDLDFVYYEAFENALKAGVEAYAYCCNITKQAIEITDEIPIIPNGN